MKTRECDVGGAVRLPKQFYERPLTLEGTPHPEKFTSCRNIPKRYSRGGSDTLTRSGLACGLKTSPPLTPTDIIREGVTPYVNGGCKDAHGNYRRFQGRNERDPKTRSKTFPGVAQAMAQQWGGDMSG